jgi:hypothetical protein
MIPSFSPSRSPNDPGRTKSPPTSANAQECPMPDMIWRSSASLSPLLCYHTSGSSWIPRSPLSQYRLKKHYSGVQSWLSSSAHPPQIFQSALPRTFHSPSRNGTVANTGGGQNHHSSCLPRMHLPASKRPLEVTRSARRVKRSPSIILDASSGRMCAGAAATRVPLTICGKEERPLAVPSATSSSLLLL